MLLSTVSVKRGRYHTWEVNDSHKIKSWKMIPYNSLIMLLFSSLTYSRCVSVKIEVQLIMDLDWFFTAAPTVLWLKWFQCKHQNLAEFLRDLEIVWIKVQSYPTKIKAQEDRARNPSSKAAQICAQICSLGSFTDLCFGPICSSFTELVSIWRSYHSQKAPTFSVRRIIFRSYKIAFLSIGPAPHKDLSRWFSDHALWSLCPVPLLSYNPVNVWDHNHRGKFAFSFSFDR